MCSPDWSPVCLQDAIPPLVGLLRRCDLHRNFSSPKLTLTVYNKMVKYATGITVWLLPIRRKSTFSVHKGRKMQDFSDLENCVFPWFCLIYISQCEIFYTCTILISKQFCNCLLKTYLLQTETNKWMKFLLQLYVCSMQLVIFLAVSFCFWMCFLTY